MGNLLRKPLVVTAAGALSLLICLPAGGASDAVREAAATVTVGNNFFSPTGKTIRRGGSVSWVWRGGRPHDVVGRNARGRVVFKSGRSSRRGHTFRHRFRAKGRYQVICTVHPARMKMTVRVR